MAAHPARWSDAAEEHRAGKLHSACPTETRGCPRSERRGNHSHSDRQREPPLQLVRRISARPGERWSDLASLHLLPLMLLRIWSTTKGHKRAKSLSGECQSLRRLQDLVLKRNISPEPSVSPDRPKRKQKTEEKVENYDCLQALSVVCDLPPRFLHCRNYDRDSEPSYPSGLGFVPCTEKKCPAPNRSTKSVHPCPDWCHSSGMCLNNVDTPAGKLLGSLQDWVSGPFVQPPDSTVLQQKSGPSAGCLWHPTAPSAVELAFLLERQTTDKSSSLVHLTLTLI